MNTYTPARAVMVIQDNGEDVMVELPEIQELLDEISNLKCKLYEVCRDADLEIAKERGLSRRQTRRMICFAVPGWLLLAATVSIFLVRRYSS